MIGAGFEFEPRLRAGSIETYRPGNHAFYVDHFSMGLVRAAELTVSDQGKPGDQAIAHNSVGLLTWHPIGQHDMLLKKG